MLHKNTKYIADSEDPDQTAPRANKYVRNDDFHTCVDEMAKNTSNKIHPLSDKY